MAKKYSPAYIKQKENESDKDFNDRAGNFAGIVGLIVNVLLFASKLAVGLLASSISIVADAVNNLTDSFSSCVVLLSFYLSKKPADKEHPFGHARYEYLFSSVVALVIVVVGLQLMIQSALKIKTPTVQAFSAVTIVVLVMSILAKLFLSRFYGNIAKRIRSPILTATSADSKADVLSTSVILISIPVYHFTKFSVDSYLGLVVSILIIKSGFDILKDTIDRILGMAPSSEQVKKVRDFILSYDGIEGIHDLIIHDYGSHHCFASAHAEIDAATDVIKSHELLDKIESDAIQKLNVQLVLHMDPLVKNDPHLNEAFTKVNRALEKLDIQLGIHDFRIVHSFQTTNVVFDVNVPASCKLTDEQLSGQIIDCIKKYEPSYNPVITIDRNYIRSSSLGNMV